LNKLIHINGVDMKNLLLILISLYLFACNKQANEDLINNNFPKAQEEIRKVINSIVLDAETANIEGLQSIHLGSINLQSLVQEILTVRM